MSSDREHLDDQKFILAVKHLSDSLVYGSDQSPYFGSGVDYAQSRLYSSGDPIKAIDWRVTARTGKVHVKEFESLKHVPVWLVVDQSASMGLASVYRSKWDWAIMLAGAIALAAVNRSSPVGLFGTGQPASKGGQPTRHQPSLSREPIYHWLCELRRIAPRSRSQKQISRTLLELEVAAREHSLIFILSDLHEQNVAGAIKRLAQRHEVVLLRLQDPAEAHLPIHGFFRGQEAESGMQFTTRRRNVNAAIHQLDADLRNAGVDAITLPTDSDFVPPLREFLRVRRVSKAGVPR